ncbi:hypothetical protein YPPY89_2745, partial [Yersinia pestis PY-89]
MRNIFV